MQLWHEVDHYQARLNTERISATVDCLNPVRGLRDVRLGADLASADDGDWSLFHPLQVELPEAAPDSAACERYVRGGDLIASYDNRPAPRMRTQVYWRAASQPRLGAVAAIELVASLQTDLLDSAPALAVSTSLVVTDAYQMVDAGTGEFAAIVPPRGDAPADDAPQCYLFHLPGRRFSYAEMAHPADGRQSSWDGWLHGADYRLQLRHQLVAEHLEKGVILRSRVLGVVLERHNDKQLAAAYWKAFLEEAPPLTA